METVAKNRIREMISEKESNAFRFKPSRSFFKEIGIGQKEWGLIIRNEHQPRLDQLVAIAKHFDVDPKSLF